MGIQTPGGGELTPMPKPEMRTPKPPEVKPPEVKPLGQTEQAMVARNDKDGDPDLVLRDLTKTDAPQVITSPREAQAPAVQAAETPDSAKQQTPNVSTELSKDSKSPPDTRDTPASSENSHSPSKPLFINEDPRFDAIAKELSNESLERSIKSLMGMGKSREDALHHMEVFGGARRHPDGSLRVQFYPQKIHSVFAERYPEDYAGYQKIEPLGEQYQESGHRAFRYRQIARYAPERARQMAEDHQSKYGEPDAELVRAIQQAEELKQNPIAVPPEDPRYAELADSMQTDPALKAIQDELHVSDWQAVLGADYQNRIKQMTTDQYSELINSDKVFGLSSSKDRRASELFRERFPDKARLYREREITRVYRDPDGVINPQLDPEYRSLDRSQMFEDRNLKDFARRFPEKAVAYASVNPKLKTAIEQVQLETRAQTTPNPVEVNRETTNETVQQSTNETVPLATPSVRPETTTQQQADVEEATESQAAQNETVQAVAPTYETKPVNSAEEVSLRIREQMSDSMKALTIDDLEKRKQELKNRPQVGSKALTDTLVGVDQQSTFAWVQTDKIVGRTWEQSDSWASEIEARKGRATQVAKEIIDSDGSPQAMEHVFHPGKASERIKLTAIDGPAGPIYYVDDGTHRVAASMTAGLVEIPCDVKQIRYPLEQIAHDDSQVTEWQRAIDRGLIDGEIQEYVGEGGKRMQKIIVKNEVLPWIRTTSQSDLMKISRIYEQLYPGSLNQLKIPREALVDPIANNFFMAGRWEEWIQRQQEFAGNS